MAGETPLERRSRELIDCCEMSRVLVGRSAWSGENRVRRERKAGATLQAIADGLNRDKVATGQGGKCWHPSSVRTVAGEGR
jgi:hypothetical protein